MIMDAGPRSRKDSAVAAKLFRGLADPTRLEILLALADGESRVVDLVGRVGTSQPNVSAHLACLKQCGLVEDRPVGRQVFYRIRTQEVIDLLLGAQRVLSTAGYSVDLCPNYLVPGAPRAESDA